MMKTGQSRIDDAVTYIYGMGKSELANHLAQTVASGNAPAIGKELSLGSRPGGQDDPLYGTNTRQRQALRALLLCQRVYLSDLWWEWQRGQRYNALANGPNWKTASLNHWKSKGENEIQDGILTYSVTTANAGSLADTALAKRQPLNRVAAELTLTRNTTPFPGLTSCYGSVMTWLFASGLVSYRWFAKHNGARDKASLRAAFGHGRTLIKEDEAFAPGAAFPAVPRGHIVHLYCDGDQVVRFNGHWLVSLGDGTAAGCNNDTTDGTPNDYTPGGSLANQFLNGYRDPIDGHPGKFWKGIAEVVDPTQIPGRM